MYMDNDRANKRKLWKTFLFHRSTIKHACQQGERHGPTNWYINGGQQKKYKKPMDPTNF